MSLYKYVRAERALDILKTGLIRFSQPAALNDPFELRPPITSTTSACTFAALREESLVELWNELPGKRKQIYGSFPSWRKEMLTTGAAAYREAAAESTAAAPENERNLHIALNRTTGVLCLTTKRDDLTMWAHYADNHEGCVLGFDESHQFFNQRQGPSATTGRVVAVDYEDERPQQALSDLTDRNVFFVKSGAWKHEHEQRMILLLKEARETKTDSSNPQFAVHLFSIPPDCITTLILGCRMRLDARHKLCEIVRSDPRYRGVCVLRAVPDIGNFSFKFEDLGVHSEGRNSMEITVQVPTANVLDELDVRAWPIWEKEVSEFPWHYDEKETCYLLEGDVTVTPEGGKPVRFGKGDLVTFPAGMSCVWKVHKPVRKHYKFG